MGDETNLQKVRDLLQNEKVQGQIHEHMHKSHKEARVTIGRAAELFGFSEAKLREFDRTGLLKPVRSKDTATGQRQFSLTELDKLAIIRTLVDAGCSPNEIPPDVDKLWLSIHPPYEQEYWIDGGDSTEEVEPLHIDAYMKDIYSHELFWRYFISHVLRQALALICEDIPGVAAGLVLPLRRFEPHIAISDSKELGLLGEALIGWRGESQTFYAYLTSTPSFDFPSDFRIHPLQEMKDGELIGAAPLDNIYIVVDRRVRPFSVSAECVYIIRTLLHLLYEKRDAWRPGFVRGPRDFTIPGTNSNLIGTNPSDVILTQLAEIILSLRRKGPNGQKRWSYCYILFPKDFSLSLQQRSLIVYAKSGHAPHKVGVTTFAPNERHIVMRAYQAGKVVYRDILTDEDFSAALRNIEGAMSSAVAIPVGGNDGFSVAVIYIASREQNAFSRRDLQVLRIMSGLVKELVTFYAAWQPGVGKQTEIITNPEIVDTIFKDFSTENDFVHELETILTNVGMTTPQEEPASQINAEHERSFTDTTDLEVISFISLDIDNQRRLATKYGDVTARSMSRAVGRQTERLLREIFPRGDYRLYHIYADRFYMMLRNVDLDKARQLAEKMRQTLGGTYQIAGHRTSFESPVPHGSLQEIPDIITVRLGVASYPFAKLKNLLSRYSVAELRGLIIRDLDYALSLGLNARKDVVGDAVISWNPDKQKDAIFLRFELWSPRENV
ncbi:MAG TPA: MerR family transcriptional regulator [Ktedonobacteraceae bacterium]|nr:MerR family transcriptional regulator [Ktedonobacteraceae bacterium]